MSLDLTRYRGLATVAATLAAALLLADTALTLGLGWAPRLLYPPDQDMPQAFSVVEESYGRLAAVAGSDAAAAPFGLVAGMSTTRYGIDVRLLERLDDAELPYLKVVGSHASFENLEAVLAPVRRLRLRPARVVLGLHYGMLAGTRHEQPEFDRRLAAVRAGLARGEDRAYELQRALSLTFLGNNRAQLLNRVELALLERRDALLSALGQDFGVVYPAVAEPWSDYPNPHRPRPPSAWRDRLELRERQGWFSPDSYRVDGPGGEALLRTLADLRDCPDVVIVLLPEHSRLRARMPYPRAEQVMDELLLRSGRAGAIRIVDLRSIVDDAEFGDEAHVTPAGSRVLTLALARALAGSPPAGTRVRRP